MRQTGFIIMFFAAIGIFGSANAVQSDTDQCRVAKSAVAHSGRSEADVARDANRKPAEILTFAGIKPAMTVLDINSGGGYYSEILSYLVGPAGKVYAHNDSIYLPFAANAVKARYADNRLANIEELHQDFDQLALAESSVDTAVAMISFHDFFFLTGSRTAPVDIATGLQKLYQILKPGGVFIIVDHVAPSGTGPEDFNKLHRIDPAYVESAVKAAGFELVATSDILANNDDNNKMSPFDPAIRGKTNRFVMKFKRPG